MTTSTSAGTATTPRQRIWQRILVAVGLGIMAVGGLALVLDVRPTAYLGILVWFAGAIIVHDGIIGPVVFGVAVLMRKTRRRIPIVVIAIVQAAIVVAAITAAIVLPEAFKKQAGTANPTILPLDYVGNLGAFYVALALLTGFVVTVYLLVSARREKKRPAVDQD